MNNRFIVHDIDVSYEYKNNFFLRYYTSFFRHGIYSTEKIILLATSSHLIESLLTPYLTRSTNSIKNLSIPRYEKRKAGKQRKNDAIKPPTRFTRIALMFGRTF